MKQGMPWSVKGVDTDARDAAKEAARLSGMTLGEWLNTVIAETATEAAAARGGTAGAAVAGSLGRQNRVSAQTAAAAPAGANDLAGVLKRAIETSRQHSAGVEVRTAGALEAMLRWIERTDKQRRDEMGSIAHAQERTSVALREALILVTSRLDVLERNFDSGPERDLGPVRAALSRLAGRIDDLDRREAEGPVPEQVTQTLRLLEGRLVDIAQRLDRVPGPELAPDRITRIETALGALVDMLRSPQTHGADDLPDGADGDGCDSALRQIRARQAALDELALRVRQDVKRDLGSLSADMQDILSRPGIESLQATLRDLGEQIAASREEAAASRQTGALDRLSDRFSALTAELAPLKAVDDLREEISRLGQGLERLPEEVAAAPLRQIVAEIGELKALVESSAAAASPVEKAVELLSDRIDESIARALPGSVDTAGLQKSIEDMRWTLGALSDVARKPDPGIARIEQRLDEVTGWLESIAAAQAAAVPDTEALQSLLAGLGVRMDEAARPEAAGRSLEALENQIHIMTEALGRADDNVAALRAMESAMSELFARIEDSKRSTIEAAEKAAARAAETAARSAPEGSKPSEAPDRRTRNALEGVQDTMERVVERLAMLEADITSDRVRLMELAERAAKGEEPAAAGKVSPPPRNAAEKIAAAAAAAEAAHALDPSAVRPPRVKAAAQEPPFGSTRSTVSRPAPPAIPAADAMALAAAARSSMMPADTVPAEENKRESDLPAPPRAANDPQPAPAGAVLADDMLLEPGSGRPVPVVTAAEKTPEKDVADPAGTRMASFIASARQAARGAVGATGRSSARAQRRQEAAGRAAAKATAAEAGAKDAGDAPADPARRTMERRRRPLLLALAAVVLALGCAQIARNVLTEPAREAPRSDQPPRKEQSSSLSAPASPQAPGGFTPPGEAAAPSSDPDTVGAIGLSQTARGAPQTPDIPSGALPPALTRAVSAGSPAAAYEIAARYFEGRTLPRDLKASVRWFERAATRGFAPAQYRLGSMYEKGLGVTADAVTARNWYRQAADRGNAKAMHNLGVLVAEGGGGKPDYEQAIVWFHKAADLGVRDSQYNLAILLARGLGGPVNLSQSYTWFAIAAAGGDEDAGRKRDEVGLRLDAATLVAAKAAAEAYRPGRLDDAANDPGAPVGGWEAVDASATQARPDDARKAKAKVPASGG